MIDPEDLNSKIRETLDERRTGKARYFITLKSQGGNPCPLYKMLCLIVEWKPIDSSGADVRVKILATARELAKNFEKQLNSNPINVRSHMGFTADFVRNIYDGQRFGDEFVKKHGPGLYAELNEKLHLLEESTEGAGIEVGEETHTGYKVDADGRRLEFSRADMPKGQYVYIKQLGAWKHRKKKDLLFISMQEKKGKK